MTLKSILAKHRTTFKIVQLYYTSIKKAKEQNPYLMDFKYNIKIAERVRSHIPKS